MSISFEGRVAIVTGAGGGIGRAYALELARRGAKVVVNDLGGARDGTGHSDAALKVVEEIEAAGGEAILQRRQRSPSSTRWTRWSRAAKARWGGVHILINNAGVLRDKSFAKMEPEDFRLRRQRPPHRLGLWHQGGVGNDARADLRAHPDDRELDRAVRQFRPGELRRGQAGPRRPDQDARASKARNTTLKVNTIAPVAAHAHDRGHLPRSRRSRRSRPRTSPPPALSRGPRTPPPTRSSAPARAGCQAACVTSRPGR